MSQVGWWGLWRSWEARPAWCAASATACPTSSDCRTKAWPAGRGPSSAGCREGPLPSSNTSQKVGCRSMLCFTLVYVCTGNLVEQRSRGTAEARRRVDKYWFCVKAPWRPSPTWQPAWPGTWTACLWTRSTTPGRRSGGGSCRRASGTGWGRDCRASASACWVRRATPGLRVDATVPSRAFYVLTVYLSGLIVIYLFIYLFCLWGH